MLYASEIVACAKGLQESVEKGECSGLTECKEQYECMQGFYDMLILEAARVAEMDVKKFMKNTAAIVFAPQIAMAKGIFGAFKSVLAGDIAEAPKPIMGAPFKPFKQWQALSGIDTERLKSLRNNFASLKIQCDMQPISQHTKHVELAIQDEKGTLECFVRLNGENMETSQNLQELQNALQNTKQALEQKGV